MDNNDISEWMVYPNPSDGIIQIRNTIHTEQSRLSIYNLAGQLVKQEKWVTDTVHQLELSQLSNRLYLLVVHDARGQLLGQKRIIKK